MFKIKTTTQANIYLFTLFSLIIVFFYSTLFLGNMRKNFMDTLEIKVAQEIENGGFRVIISNHEVPNKTRESRVESTKKIEIVDIVKYFDTEFLFVKKGNIVKIGEQYSTYIYNKDVFFAREISIYIKKKESIPNELILHYSIRDTIIEGILMFALWPISIYGLLNRKTILTLKNCKKKN